VIFSLVALGTVYAVLLVVEVILLGKYIRGGVVSAMPELANHRHKDGGDANDGDSGDGGEAADDVLAFAY
jgi:cytochrome d ubiquinol oxidase subunit I